MVKQIMLDEIVLQKDISPEKSKFLEACKKRINEAVDIYAEINPKFNRNLFPESNPFQMIIESSKNYDAEIKAGAWCSVDSIRPKNNLKERVHILRVDSEMFLFDYQRQTFRIKY